MEVNKVFEDFFQEYRKIELEEDLATIHGRWLPKISVNKESESIINQVDQILKTKNPSTLEELHTLVYCGAQTVIELCQRAKIPVYDQKDIPNEFPPSEKEESQKKLLRISPKKFRRLLLSKIMEEEEKIPRNPKTPTIGEIEDFWSKLWEENSTHNEERVRKFVQMEKKRMEPQVATSDDAEITEKDLRRALKAKQNWSTPGVDGIQTFWYKKFKSLHTILVEKINCIIKQEEKMPKFFTQGFTELHPKNEKTQKASNYRPITHLPAIYKIITRCIYEKIFAHFEAHGVLADEQYGGRRGCYGVKKALVIDSVLLEQKPPVFGCYVDYQKAFDMVPHSWILKMLQVYRVDPFLVEFIRKSMENWKTRVFLALEESSVLSRNFYFKRGIFQGDSLSVLFFWTTINPLSFALRQTKMGMKFEDRFLSHVLYMDDLKLYSSNFEALKNLFQVVEEFSDAISMKINYEKTKMFLIPDAKEENTQTIDDHGKIKYTKEYTYLGYKQGLKINHEVTIKKKVWSFDKKLKLIEESKVSEDDKNKIKTFLGHSLCRSFGILRWKKFEGELSHLTFNKNKFLKIVKKQNEDLPEIHLKMLDILCKMRKDFYLQKGKSVLMEIIVKNDNRITPLNLSLSDDKKFIEGLPKKGIKLKKRKNDEEDGEASI